MANETFKAGDVVKLRSGGPEMTVDYVEDNGYAYCTWYDFNTHALNSERAFRLTSLKIVSEKSGSFL